MQLRPLVNLQQASALRRQQLAPINDHKAACRHHGQIHRLTRRGDRVPDDIQLGEAQCVLEHRSDGLKVRYVVLGQVQPGERREHHERCHVAEAVSRQTDGLERVQVPQRIVREQERLPTRPLVRRLKLNQGFRLAQRDEGLE